MKSILLIQIIGAIGYTLLALSYFKKSKNQILLMQIVAYVFFAIHYYLLTGVTGAICNLMGLFALITIYLFEKFNFKSRFFLAIFLMLALIIINILTFQNIFSIFPMIASVIVIVSFLMNNENSIRMVGVLAAVCWLVYAIAYKSYVAIMFEIITLIDVCIAYLKNKSNNT